MKTTLNQNQYPNSDRDRHSHQSQSRSGDQASPPRINLLGPYLKELFGGKAAKLSLDGGFTCPNRDGSLGYGGCSFCSGRGSGDNASAISAPAVGDNASVISAPAASGNAQCVGAPPERETMREKISAAISAQISLLSAKWPGTENFIAYFQNYTSTYADTTYLRELYYAALAHPKVKGLAIATRPDCLPADVLDLLSEINEKTFLWVELGLQTTNDDTARAFGRGYDTSVYHETVAELGRRNIKIVTHVLLGLPGETREDMLRTVTEVCGYSARPPLSGSDAGASEYKTKPPVWGLKFHLLNVISGTRLAEEMPDYVPFSSPEEYAALVCDLLEYVPIDVIMHRLSADSPAELLVAPKWAYRKRRLLDMIQNEMVRRNSYQGSSLIARSLPTLHPGLER